MSLSRALAALISGTLGLTACSTTFTAPSTAELAADMIEAMGGREALETIETLTLRGDGERTRLGQLFEAGGEDPVAALEGVTEVIDLANGRAALDNTIDLGDFSQHRTEVLTAHNGVPVGWGSTVGRPNMAATPNGLFSWATQNSPAWLLRRNIVTVALAAADTASDAEVAEEREFDGRGALYGTARIGDEDIGLYFDPDTGLLAGFTALDTEPMLGDVDAEYVFGDYREVDGRTLPGSLTIRKEGRLFSSIVYDSIAINGPTGLDQFEALGIEAAEGEPAPDIFDIPADIVDQADAAAASGGSWSPVTLNPVAPNVYHAVTFSHHSMVVEFPDFVAVVEGGYTEGQAITIAQAIDAAIGKPIRYIAPTHPHFDHTGGVRGFASVGADVLVAAGHESQLRAIVESPHTNPPDQLAARAAAGEDVGSVEVFEGMIVITGGDQTLELYATDAFDHVNPMVVAYVPGAGAIFQSDLAPTAPGADAEAMVGLAREHGWTVEAVVGGHGGVSPWSDVLAAAGGN